MDLGSNRMGRTHFPLRVKIFFSTVVWFMVLKRSVFKVQKQHNKFFEYPIFRYKEIHENVPKLRNCAKLRDFETFS